MDAITTALQPILIPAFTLWGAPFTWLELIAFVLSIAMVFANMRVMPVAWPLAIVSSLLYFGLFWSYKLYGDGSLQIFFAVVALWGWWQWLRGTDDGSPLVVRHLPDRALLPVVAAGLVLWPAIGWFLDTYTDTDVPYWDAFPTAFSLIGQWLLARKYVENWPTWIVVNVVSVALFAYKGLYLTVLLYAIFVVLSVVGWRAWRAQVNHP
jgi:nicotinamide mononucleotide transporter